MTIAKTPVARCSFALGRGEYCGRIDGHYGGHGPESLDWEVEADERGERVTHVCLTNRAWEAQGDDVPEAVETGSRMYNASNGRDVTIERHFQCPTCEAVTTMTESYDKGMFEDVRPGGSDAD